MDALAQPGVELRADALQRLGRWARGRPVPPRAAAQAGASALRRHGRGLEPHEIRPWSLGDEARHVDRNASARRGAPQVRVFRDEREPHHALLVDLRPAMLFGTRRAFRSVAAAEAVTLLAWRLVRQGARIGGVALTGRGAVPLRGGLGERAMTDLILGLVDAHARALRAPIEADPPLDDALAAAAEHLPRGGTVTLATTLDVPGPGLDGVLLTLRRRSGLRLVLLADPFETAPPRGAYPYRAGGDGASRFAVIDGPVPTVPQPSLAARLGLPSATIETTDDPVTVLAKLDALDHGRP